MSEYKSTVSEEVMQKIKHGNVRMKPRLYFSLLSAATLSIGLIAGMVLAYLWSIVFFWIKVETADGMAYGARRNLGEAITAFPWWALIIAAALLVLVVLLVRKHGAIYRHKPLTVALVVVLISIGAGLLLSSWGVGDIGHARQDGRNPERGNHSPQQNYMK